jgi:N-formylglutamate deformylase
MTPAFEFRAGQLPLLISVPHDGREIPTDIKTRMTDAGRSMPDTDWHVTKLYEFAADMGANILAANYSRYVVDLNRPADDVALYPGQVSTGLCPLQTFSGESIYGSGGIDDEEKSQRVERYWRPYHQKISATLEALRAQHGYALLWDAHSISSVVPRLFDGELPELNLGSNSGASCGESIQNDVAAIATTSSFSTAINGRFTGGYITRRYSEPENSIHALQLEIAQRAYMNEQTVLFDESKAVALRDTLRKMLDAYLLAARNTTGIG